MPSVKDAQLLLVLDGRVEDVEALRDAGLCDGGERVLAVQKLHLAAEKAEMDLRSGQESLLSHLNDEAVDLPFGPAPLPLVIVMLQPTACHLRRDDDEFASLVIHGGLQRHPAGQGPVRYG